MPQRSSSVTSPPSTHASLHLLIGPDSLPRVSANVIAGQQLSLGETVFLHVEAEHRTLDFDHTATFTVSGPRGAIDRLLARLRAAIASLPTEDPDDPDPEPGSDPDLGPGPGPDPGSSSDPDPGPAS